MTKPREKTREELQAEIEGGKKKIRQFENREKMLRQKLFKEERRTRSHRLIVRGAVFESIVPEAKGMTNEESATFLLLLCHVYFSFFQALNSDLSLTFYHILGPMSRKVQVKHELFTSIICFMPHLFPFVLVLSNISFRSH